MKNFSRKQFVLLITFFIVLLFSQIMYADPVISLVNQGDLEEHSTKNISNSTLTLLPGDYEISSDNSHEIDLTAADNYRLWSNFVIGSDSNDEKIDTILSVGLKATHEELIFTTRNIILNNSGKLIAKGGNGPSKFGIYNRGKITQNGGEILAYGGIGGFSHGIDVSDFELNAGFLYAAGSKGGSADGIFSKQFIQKNGVVTALGGGGEEASGIRAQNFTQNNGFIWIEGGSGKKAYGLKIISSSNDEKLIQNGGEMYALSGSGEKAYGIYAQRTAEFSGSLTLLPGGNFASVYVLGALWHRDDTVLTFGENSTLTIQLNDDEENIGWIEVNTGKTEIVPGAKLVVDGHLIKSKEEKNIVFIKNNDGTINGKFDYAEETLTYSLSAQKVNYNTEYTLNFQRKYTPDELISDVNSKMLVEAVFIGDPESEFLQNIQYDLDNFGVDEKALFDQYINDLSDNLIPYEIANFANFGMDNINFLRTLLIQDLASNNEGSFEITARPLAQFGTYKDRQVSQRLLGGQLEFKYGDDSYTIALNVHYLNGNRENDITWTKSNLFGAMLGGSYDFSLFNQNFSADVLVGYSHQTLDSYRKAYDEELYAQTKANIMNVSIGLSDYIAISKAALVPRLGVDYTFINIGEFEEIVGELYALSIAPEKFNSLKINVGLNAIFLISQNLKLSANVGYSYDLLRNAISSTFINDTTITFESESGKSPHDISAGLHAKYDISNKVNLGLDLDVNFFTSYFIFSTDFKLGVKF